MTASFRTTSAGGPSAIFSPSSRTTTRWERGITTSMTCSTTQSARPSSPWIRRTSSTAAAVSAGGGPHMAPSSKSTRGAGDAEPRDALWAGAADVGAGEDDPPRVRVRVAGDAVEERGLAGSVRADEPDDLARRDRERDLLVGDEAAEALRDGAELEKRRHAQPRPTSRAEALRRTSPRAQRLHGSERIPVGRRAAIRTMMMP